MEAVRTIVKQVLFGAFICLVFSCTKAEDFNLNQNHLLKSQTSNEKSDLVQSIINDTLFVQYFNLFEHFFLTPMDSVIENNGIEKWLSLLNDFSTCFENGDNQISCFGLVSNLRDIDSLNNFLSTSDSLLDALRMKYSSVEDSLYNESLNNVIREYVNIYLENHPIEILINLETGLNPSNEVPPCFQAYQAARELNLYIYAAEITLCIAGAVVATPLVSFECIGAANVMYGVLEANAYHAYCKCMEQTYDTSVC